MITNKLFKMGGNMNVNYKNTRKINLQLFLVYITLSKSLFTKNGNILLWGLLTYKKQNV